MRVEKVKATLVCFIDLVIDLGEWKINLFGDLWRCSEEPYRSHLRIIILKDMDPGEIINRHFSFIS